MFLYHSESNVVFVFNQDISEPLVGVPTGLNGPWGVVLLTDVFDGSVQCGTLFVAHCRPDFLNATLLGRGWCWGSQITDQIAF